jgi:hypothetical protein
MSHVAYTWMVAKSMYGLAVLPLKSTPFKPLSSQAAWSLVPSDLYPSSPVASCNRQHQLVSRARPTGIHTETHTHTRTYACPDAHTQAHAYPPRQGEIKREMESER